MMPVSRRVLGRSNVLTLRLSYNYARALYNDPDATLDQLREAELILDDAARTARRVLGGAHPLTSAIELYLRRWREGHRAREAPSA